VNQISGFVNQIAGAGAGGGGGGAIHWSFPFGWVCVVCNENQKHKPAQQYYCTNNYKMQ
jgi:hypothetical protein